jgi:alpha-beta hydrolase superfamily lysophospholipase
MCLFVFLQGGAIALLATLENPGYFDGIITSDPFVIPTRGVPSKIQVRFAE